MERHFTITGGPSKFDLSISLFRGRKDSDEVEFLVEDPEGGQNFSFLCRITGVETEDGGRENWNLKGWAKYSGRHMEAYFNTQRRQGHIVIKTR